MSAGYVYVNRVGAFPAPRPPTVCVAPSSQTHLRLVSPRTPWAPGSAAWPPVRPPSSRRNEWSWTTPTPTSRPEPGRRVPGFWGAEQGRL